MEELLKEKWRESRLTPWAKGLAAKKSLLNIMIVTQIEQRAINPNILICSDGRCPHLGNEVSIEGAGILMDEATLDKVIIESKIGAISSHSKCGAGELAFNMAKDKLGARNSEEYVVAWARLQAQKYNLRYRHIDTNEFSSPVHHERGIILDSTLKFHPAFFRGMPNFFISNSSRFAEDEYIVTAIQALTAIGFSDHAFGAYFTPRDPFYVLIGGRSDHERFWLEDMVKTALTDYGEKVVVESIKL